MDAIDLEPPAPECVADPTLPEKFRIFWRRHDWRTFQLETAGFTYPEIEAKFQELTAFLAPASASDIRHAAYRLLSYYAEPTERQLAEWHRALGGHAGRAMDLAVTYWIETSNRRPTIRQFIEQLELEEKAATDIAEALAIVLHHRREFERTTSD